MMLDDAALDTLFRTARTFYSWADTPVSDEALHTLYELAKLGPTAANSSPARFVFCRSVEARETLATCVSAANAPKVRTAPVTAIVGMDMEFYEKLPQLFPHADARSWFAGKPDAIHETAFRNSSLQGAYFILAARSLGIDCGPMSGFDAAKMDEEFWAGTTVKTNFICNLGHGDSSKLFPRSPRLSFEQACRFD